MTIQEYLNERMGITKGYVVESKDLTDNELVQLSVINFGTILPNKVESKIRKRLVEFGYLDEKGSVTKEGQKFLKDKKTIKRLADIAN